MNDADTAKIVTYILFTESGEYYCGKTKNISKRLYQHKTINKKSWFNNTKRCLFDAKVINGDFEKQIKRAGVKLIFKILNAVSAS